MMMRVMRMRTNRMNRMKMSRMPKSRNPKSRNLKSQSPRPLRSRNPQGRAIIDVYLTQGNVGGVVGYPNIGRSVLGCIEADLCD